MTASLTPAMDAAAVTSTLVLVALLGLTSRRRTMRCLAGGRLATDAVSGNRPSRQRPHSPAALTVQFTQATQRRRARRSLLQPSPAELAAVLDRIARHCASGESLAHAFVAAATKSPLAELFEPATTALSRGSTIGDALATVHVQHADAALAVHSLRLCAEHGGAVSESLDRGASTLRERHTIKLERVAQGAQARLSATVLTVVPVAFGGWTLATTPSVQRFVATPPGMVCVVVGLACNVGGWQLMARSIRGAS